jgi:hypothetical protein
MTTIELSMTARATAVFAAIGRQRGALWIDDATFVEPPFMGCHPVAQLIVRRDGSVLRRDREVVSEIAVDPIRAIVRFLEGTPPGALPWTVGFLAYDRAPYVETCMRLARDPGDGASPRTSLATTLSSSGNARPVRTDRPTTRCSGGVSRRGPEPPPSARRRPR